MFICTYTSVLVIVYVLKHVLQARWERLKVIFNEATSALTDDVSEVSQFCVSLECCLRHHQRGDDMAEF